MKKLLILLLFALSSDLLPAQTPGLAYHPGMVNLKLPPLKKPLLWHPGFPMHGFRQPEPADLKGTLLLLSPVAKDHIYQREFGLFCRLEKSVNVMIQFPVKLRLGEVEYVERMEGKR